jgi:general secretion pathway protein D
MRHFATLCAALILTVLVAMPAPVRAQETFVVNLRDADISMLIEQISEITGRTLVIDPALTGDVTVVSAEALDKDGVWSLFQSIWTGNRQSGFCHGNVASQ